MRHATYTSEEIARRGEELSEQQIRAKAEPGNLGKIVVIDVETGDYEIDEDHLAANRRARAKNPNAVLYGLRIGYPAIGKISGWSTVWTLRLSSACLSSVTTSSP